MILRLTNSLTRSPAEYAVINSTRCLRPRAARIRRTISSGLKTSARGEDCLRGGMNNLFSSHPRVSL